MDRETSTTMQYAGCAGCVGAGVLLVAGGGLGVYGWYESSNLPLVIGCALGVLALVVGMVSSVVNNIGFSRRIIDRIEKRR